MEPGLYTETESNIIYFMYAFEPGMTVRENSTTEGIVVFSRRLPTEY